MFSQGGQGGGGGGLFGGLGDIFGGLFGHPERAYEDAQKQYEKYFNQAQQYQNPFYNAGQQGLGNYQQWLQGQQDPSKFINDQMGKYQESPYAHNLQNQAMNAANNVGSASGLTGSTPLQMQAQQNAGNIASQDQNQWLQHVLGIHSQYGQGQMGLANMGQQAGNNLSNMYNQAGQDMSQFAYNKRRAQDQRWPQIFSGLGQLFM